MAGLRGEPSEWAFRTLVFIFYFKKSTLFSSVAWRVPERLLYGKGRVMLGA